MKDRDLSELMPSKTKLNAAYGVGLLSEHIARLMKEIHGGEWSVRVDHDTQLVSIRRRFPLNHT